MAHGIGGKFLEKKIFQKRYLNVFPRWDYKGPVIGGPKFLNINPYIEGSLAEHLY